jgi:hypothetical protein
MIMIKANELRIGNLVDLQDGDFGCTQKILGITETHVTVNYQTDVSSTKRRPVNFLLTQLKPIPITEDILKMAGFQIGIDINKLYLRYGYLASNGKIVFTQLDVNDKHYGIGDFAAKYLHQLQNLYFALTGEELNIKL